MNAKKNKFSSFVSVVCLSGLGGLVGCASNELKSDLTKYRGLVMDADLTKERGGVGNYVFSEGCGCSDSSRKSGSNTNPQPVANASPIVVATPSVAAPVAKLVGNKIEISQQINFDLGKATLTKQGKAVLDQVAGVIAANADKISKINIAGHTDHFGDAKRNMDLSEKRAASVKAYLVSKAISSNILSSQGFGFTQPKYQLGQASKSELALNRRVEFHCEMKQSEMD